MSLVSRQPAASASVAFIPPLAPTLVDTPPSGDGWIHEIKHDGFRTLVLVERGRARAFSRRGLDWTARYPRIVAAAEALPCVSAIIDGEAVVQDEVGRSDLAASTFPWMPSRIRSCSSPSTSSTSTAKT
jgi:ATP-dependent DNA ligase